MIYHVLLLRLASNVSEEKAQVLFEEAQKLTAIPGVVDVTCGTQEAMYPAYADRTAGYTHAMIIRLNSKEDLEAYDTHPVHIKFRESVVTPLLNREGATPAVLAVDYETGDWLDIQPDRTKHAIIAGAGVLVGCLLTAAVFLLRARN